MVPANKKIKLNTELPCKEFQSTVESTRPKECESTLAVDLLQLERTTMGKDWFEVFENELNKSYFQKLKRFLLQEENASKIIYPPCQDVYSFTRLTPLNQIKVVILGQDPYHGPGQAHGLCFSVKNGVAPPPSLVNIYKELSSDVQDFNIPKHGFLENWALEGVLLLNATLTVRKGEANSHSSAGWMTFTDSIITYLNKNSQNVVFMLWGGFAQKKAKMIHTGKHLILKATHPSPLGANKGGWFGCKHFSKANNYLIKNGKSPINWNSILK